MNDYTARIIHEDRTAQFRREADASRLASEARQGRPSKTLAARIRILGLAVAGWTTRWTERRTDRGLTTSSPSLNNGEPARITPAAE